LKRIALLSQKPYRRLDTLTDTVDHFERVQTSRLLRNEGCTLDSMDTGISN